MFGAAQCQSVVFCALFVPPGGKSRQSLDQLAVHSSRDATVAFVHLRLATCGSTWSFATARKAPPTGGPQHWELRGCTEAFVVGPAFVTAESFLHNFATALGALRQH